MQSIMYTFAFGTNHLATIYSLIPEWLSRNSLYPGRHLDHQFFLPMAEQQLIGIHLLALCSWLSLLFWRRYTHFCIGQQYHNLPYLCLACITLGYAYFKEMNIFEWSPILIAVAILGSRDLHLTQKSNLHPLSQALCLPLNYGPSTELGLSGLFEQDTYFALHWSQSTELTVANSWKVLYKLLLKYEYAFRCTTHQ